MGRPSNREISQIERRHFIGGSDARIIMGQDEKVLHRLWQEKRGEAAPIDLSGVLIVQLGLVTEDLNTLGAKDDAITYSQARIKAIIARPPVPAAVAESLGEWNEPTHGEAMLPSHNPQLWRSPNKLRLMMAQGNDSIVVQIANAAQRQRIKQGM
jgi:hypothetical protein